MDPVTIFQIVGAAVSLGDVVVKCITGLSSLKTKYQDAPLHISTMIGQLFIVRTALDQLSVWNKAENNRQPRYRELALQMGDSLSSFSVLILALQQQLDQFGSSDSSGMGAKSRIKFLWSEKEIADYSTLLDRQVNALNLLLQAMNCQTWAQQQSVMDQEGSQSVLTLAKDCSSSIFGLDDTHSFISENTANISVMFDFDNLILNSRIYKQAERSHLRQAIRAGNGHKTMSTEEPIAYNNLDKATKIRDEATSQVADERRERNSGDAGSDQLTPTRSLVRQSPVTQNTHERLSKYPNKQGMTSLASISSSKSARLVEPAQQLSTFRLSNWWRKAPQRKDTPDSLPRKDMPIPEVLILGTMESGKSTLLMALQLCLNQQLTLDQREAYRQLIRSNVIHGARCVLEAMESLEIALQDQRNEYHVQTIFMQPAVCEDCPIPEVVHAINLLWGDFGFQESYRRRREYQLHDSLRYYATDVERLMSTGYEPTNEDILRSRVKTCGIHESSYLFNDITYRLLNVGGARSERKKWIHAFGNTSTVAFTIDAHDYAKLLFEDETTNRMQEQLVLFDSIVNSRWFKASSFILVFTKIDLLEEWLQMAPVENYFPDYFRNISLRPVESYMQYLEQRFLSLIQSGKILKNTRILRLNLVDDSLKAGLEVWKTLEKLAYPQIAEDLA